MRNLLLITLALILLPACWAQTNTSTSTHKGQWWLEHSASYREAYINGYKSGWHHAIGHNSPLHPFAAAIVAQGVDKFYGDFRNRLISVDEAIDYVSEQLNGAPKDQLGGEILSLRAGAAKGAEPEQ